MTESQLLEKKYLVDKYLDQSPRPLSSFSFVNIFAWGDFFDFDFKIIDDCLCVLAKGGSGDFLYLPPLGKSLSASTIKLAFEYITQGKPPKPVNRIENIPENSLSAFGGGSYNQYAKPAEYLYPKEGLIALKGNAYKSQRHDCNSFQARYPEHSFDVYRDGDFDACQGLYAFWSEHRSHAHRDDIYRSMLQENRQVHARLLGFWQPLNLVARVLKVKDQLVGYTFGYPIDDNTFCIYAEIADWRFSGAAAYMFRAFCADKELEIFSRINTMDDFAMPNVARSKKAYHPSQLMASYTISLKTGRV